MAATRTFIIGAQASCTDGVCGDVIRVVVDPITRTVTHLVVEPKHRIALGRLVPLTLVDAATGDIHLRCTLAQFEKLASKVHTFWETNSTTISHTSLRQAASSGGHPGLR